MQRDDSPRQYLSREIETLETYTALCAIYDVQTFMIPNYRKGIPRTMKITVLPELTAIDHATHTVPNIIMAALT